jgi:hypothetical protein
MNSQLEYPVNLPYPFLNVTYPQSAVTLCDDIEIELANYFYDGNRPWITFQWAIDQVIDDTDVQSSVQTLVNTANDRDASKITIPANTLKAFMSIQLSLEVTNFLSLTTKSIAQISTYKYASPAISIKEGTNIVVTVRQPISITALFELRK